MDDSSAELLVKNNKEQVPIGALLLADDIILPQDLDFALDHQKHSRRLLGEILVSIGALEEQDLNKTLELQKKSP
ncbi:MAG: hypothetical protein A2010_16065 [Nitrospirae bacterium GWD2_57_9]|nr:MAG: hypothetical protein A2010_16065 [Nitrospirae bacterium GWD2_57_9]